MSKFQLTLIGIFVLCIIAGVTLFATYKPDSTQDNFPVITIWGTFPESTFTSLIQRLNSERAVTIQVNYVEKSPASFDKEFIENLARGVGPDAVLLPQEMLAKHLDKMVPIPYNVFSERDYKNNYIAQAELYLSPAGVMALPFTIDPLVMYWNKDMYTNAGISLYPTFWDEFTTIGNKITIKDVNSNIRRSAIALGEFSNVAHAREILSALLLQSGNPISVRGEVGFESTLGEGVYSGSLSSVPAINFFVQFSNPQDPSYSWNRSLPNSKTWFLSGTLATYFGFASELYDLRYKNSNINFDVAPLPQYRSGHARITYGNMYGFSIVRTASNQAGTYAVLQSLTAPDALNSLGGITYLPPVRRDMINTGSTDPYLNIFYDSALISRSWLDTDVPHTFQIFKNMTESITSGRADTYTALQTAHFELNQSLQNQ